MSLGKKRRTSVNGLSRDAAARGGRRAAFAAEAVAARPAHFSRARVGYRVPPRLSSKSSLFVQAPVWPAVCVCAREISYMSAARAENSICDIRLLARARPTRTRARRARNRFRAMPVEEFAGKPRAEETNFSAFFRRVPKKICCLAWEKKGRRVSGVKNFTELREKLTLMLRLTGRKNIPLYPRYNTYAGVCLDSGWRSSHVVTCQQRIYIFLIGQWYYCS